MEVGKTEMLLKRHLSGKELPLETKMSECCTADNSIQYNFVEELIQLYDNMDVELNVDVSKAWQNVDESIILNDLKSCNRVNETLRVISICIIILCLISFLKYWYVKN